MVECGDAGEVQGELVDCSSGVGAWSAGGVSAYHALGVDEAALDAGGWPAFFDGAVGSLSAVDDGDDWWADAFEEALVVEGGQAGASGAVVDELGEGCGVGDVGSVFGAGDAAFFAAPSGGFFSN